MAEMFGAPIGISRAQQDIRENELAQLRATQLMGQLAMMPAELDLKRGQAEHQRSLAVLQAQQAADLQRKQQQALFMQGLAQRAGGAEGGPGEGGPASPDDLLTRRLKGIIAQGEKEGVAEEALLPYRKSLADIISKTASEKEHLARAGNQRELALSKRAETIGQLAAVGLKDAQSYNQMLMQLSAMGVPRESFGLPAIYGPEAKARLGFLVETAHSLKEQNAMAAQDRTADAAAARADASQRQAAVAESLVGVRREAYESLIENRRKAQGGGTKDPEMRALQLESKRLQNQQRALKQFHSPPPNIEDWATDKVYTNKDGRKFRAIPDPKGAYKNKKGPISIIELKD